MAAIHGSDGGGAMTADDGAKVGGRGRLTLDRLEVEGPPASAVPRGAGAACSAWKKLQIFYYSQVSIF